MTLPTAEEREVAKDHPARKARIEYARCCACEEHQMEDGDFCKKCKTPGWVIRHRGRFEDEERQRKVETATAAGPTPEDDDLEPA